MAKSCLCMHISPYEQGNIFNVDPVKIENCLCIDGNKQTYRTYTAKGFDNYLRLYFKRGKVKLEIGVARGKKLFDKRSDIAERDANREIDRRLKESIR